MSYGVQHALYCNALTSSLRLVAASLKICYEMCHTSTVQGFVHCRSLVTQVSQVSRLKPTGLFCVRMDERTGLQCEGGNARSLLGRILNAAGSIWISQRKLLRATSALYNWAAACFAAAMAFSKTNIKQSSVKIKGNFTKLTLHLYFKCIMYYAGLRFCSVYCQ